MVETRGGLTTNFCRTPYPPLNILLLGLLEHQKVSGEYSTKNNYHLTKELNCIKELSIQNKNQKGQSLIQLCD